MKVAFFGYAWNAGLKIDAYMAETIDAFVRAGADVDLFFGQQIAKEFGIYGLNERAPMEVLLEYIAGQGYDAAISFNNSMLTPQVFDAIRGRIVTVIVDDLTHVFDYQRSGPFEVFKRDIEIVAMSSALERKLLAEVEDVRPRLHFMLPATHVDPQARAVQTLRPYPISWVASFVGDLNLESYLTLTRTQPEYWALTVRCLAMVERDGDLHELLAENGRDAQLVAALPWSFDYFQAQMRNILTNRSRVQLVHQLAPHGLALFGNAGWQKLLFHDTAVFGALQPGAPPSSHAELLKIYNGSKICVNLPQVHVDPDAVQYRVIDIMASNALVVTRHSNASDLYRVFGDDCPVPMFQDLKDLERLCVHYLNNDTERRLLVARCNQLVAEGFSFRERAAELLEIAGLQPLASAPPGQLRQVDLRPFMTQAPETAPA